MRNQTLPRIFALAFLLLAAAGAAPAMDAGQKKEFNRVMDLKEWTLTKTAKEVLAKKYPGENWSGYAFPKYVFTSAPVETGYKIAVKRPELLTRVMCACFCDAMGHKSLLDCFVKNDKAPFQFDDHAAGCNICYTQAMMAFLWAELGATDAEIVEGMKKKFGP